MMSDCSVNIKIGDIDNARLEKAVLKKKDVLHKLMWFLHQVNYTCGRSVGRSVQ